MVICRRNSLGRLVTVTLVAVAVMAAALQAFGANGPGGAPSPAGDTFTAYGGTVAVPAQREETFKGNAIPFVPFKLTDFGKNPKTGRPFQPEDMITLPRLKVPGTQQVQKDPRTGRVLRNPGTGRALVDPRSGQPRVVKARILLAELNRIEEGMNRIGQTLRSPGSVKLGRLRVDQAVKDAQRKRSAEKHIRSALPSFRPFDPSLVWKGVPGGGFAARQRPAPRPGEGKPKVSTIPRRQLSLQAPVARSIAVAKPLSRLRAAGSGSLTGAGGTASGPVFKPYNYDFNLSIPFGDPAIFAAIEDFSVSLKLEERDMTFTHVKASRASLLGLSIPITSLTITAVVPTKDNRDSTHDVMNQIFGVDLDFFPAHINFTGQEIDVDYDLWSRSVDCSSSTTFMLGPVPVTTRVGFRGAAGVQVGFEQSTPNRRMWAGVTPWIDTEVYVEAGVDMYAAEAGVGGELTLVRDTLQIGPEVSAKTDESTGEPYFEIAFGAYNQLVMLAGSVYLYARVDYYLGEKEWTYDIWSDPGIASAGYLFKIAKVHYPYSNTFLDISVDDIGDGERGFTGAYEKAPRAVTNVSAVRKSPTQTAQAANIVKIPLIVTDNQYMGEVTVWDRDGMAAIQSAGTEWRNVAGTNPGAAKTLAYREGDPTTPPIAATGGDTSTRQAGGSGMSAAGAMVARVAGPLRTYNVSPFWQFTVPVASEKSPFLVRIRVWQRGTVTDNRPFAAQVRYPQVMGGRVAFSRPKPDVTITDRDLDIAPGQEKEIWLVYDLAQHRFRSWQIPGTGSVPPPAVDRPAGEKGMIKGDNPSTLWFTAQDRGI